jgi:hypothetical protein
MLHTDTESKESFKGHKKTNYCPIEDRDFTMNLLEGCEVGTFMFLDSPPVIKKADKDSFQFRAVVDIQSIYQGMTTQPQAFYVQKYKDQYIIMWGKANGRVDFFMPEVAKSIGLDKHSSNRFNSRDEVVEHLLKYLKPYPKPEVLEKLCKVDKLPNGESEFGMPEGYSLVIDKTTGAAVAAMLASSAAMASGLAGDLWSDRAALMQV